MATIRVIFSKSKVAYVTQPLKIILWFSFILRVKAEVLNLT